MLVPNSIHFMSPSNYGTNFNFIKKTLVKYARMLAETEHKGGMFMYAGIILNDYVSYKDDQDNV